MLRMATFEDWQLVIPAAVDEDLYSLSALRNIYDVKEVILSYYHNNPIQDVFSSTVWVREDGRPTALIGLSWMNNHHMTLESWSFTTPFIRNTPKGPYGSIAYSKACKRMLDGVMEGGSCRRLYGFSWVGHSTSARWHRFLGYQEEGIARAYGARGEDFRVFSRINREATEYKWEAPQ